MEIWGRNGENGGFLFQGCAPLTQDYPYFAPTGLVLGPYSVIAKNDVQLSDFPKTRRLSPLAGRLRSAQSEGKRAAVFQMAKIFLMSDFPNFQLQALSSLCFHL